MIELELTLQDVVDRDFVDAVVAACVVVRLCGSSSRYQVVLGSMLHFVCSFS